MKYPYPEEFLWPASCKINIYNEKFERIHSSRDRALDLADLLINRFNSPEKRVVFFEISTTSPKWKTWSNKNREKIEKLIEHDICFDGHKLFILCLTIPFSRKYIPCSTPFVWELRIDASYSTDNQSWDDDEDDWNADSWNPNYDSEENVQELREAVFDEFPLLVIPSSSVSSIEIDVDFIENEQYQNGKWEDLILKHTATWVEKNDFKGKGTLWSLGSDSVNFHHHSFSMFYVIAGMPKEFKNYLDEKLSVLGKQVRKNSDYVKPSPSEGWSPRCQIQDGAAWGILDVVTWQRIEV